MTNCLGGTTKFKKVKKVTSGLNIQKIKEETEGENMGNMTFDGMIDMINVQVYTGKDVTERIVT